MADVTKFGFSKLGDNNYGTWRPRMKGVLQAKGYESALTGEEDPNSSKAMGLMMMCVQDHLLLTIEKCANAKQVWTALEHLYRQSSTANVLKLKRDLSTLDKRPKETVSQYVARAREIGDQLNAAGSKVDDDDLALAILAGLPDEYDMIKTVIEGAEELPTIENMMAKLLLVEKRTPSREGKEEEKAYIGFNKTTRPRYGNLDRPANKRHGGSDSKSSFGKMRENRTCYACGRKGHLQKDCWQRKAEAPGNKTFNRQEVALMADEPAMESKDYDEQDWVIDPGATMHIAAYPNLLINATPVENGPTVTFGNGKIGRGVERGTVILMDTDSSIQKIVLQDVYYVPEAEYNLLSTYQATSRGASFTFTKDRLDIDMQGERLLTMQPRGKLFVLRSNAAKASNAALVAKGATAQEWHERYGHLGYQNLARLIKEDMVTGIDVTAKDIEEASKDTCDTCQLSKQARLPFVPSSSATTEPLELIHMDLCGPMPTETLGGKHYVATFLDDYSGLSVIILLKRKSETAQAIKEVFTMLETQSGRKIKAVRTDRGSEYVNFTVDGYYANKGIISQTTMAYTPQQNGKAERLNRTLVEKTRAMLQDAGLEEGLWGEAIMTANFLRNRSPVSGKPKTPWELFFGKRPDVSLLRTFGSTAYVLIPKVKRTKLDKVSERGILVGYAPGGNGYRILMNDNTIVSSRDVVFGKGERSKPLQETTHTPDDTLFKFDNGETEERHPHQDMPAESEEPAERTADDSSNENEPDTAAPMLRRSERVNKGQRNDTWYMGDGRGSLPVGAGAALIATEMQEPNTLEEALSSEYAEQWQAAMDDEMSSLHANKTWTLESLPPGKTAIPVKWVYKIKHNKDGSIDRFKARLVAKGFRQKEFIDYNEVFAPVGKYATFRTLMALVTNDDMELHQLDIKTAFLQGYLDEDIYIEQPPGYTEGEDGMVCHLIKALYGLKQAPRAWHSRLHQELDSYGFKVSEADPGLYIYNDKTDNIYLMVYVDDILIAAKDVATVIETKRKLQTSFEARDLGEAETYLGINITRDRENKTLKIDQERMIKEIVAKFGQEDAKTRATPLSTSIKLAKDEGEPLDTACYPYAQLVGSLMYLAVCTRPDISYAVGALARYMAKPTLVHWKEAIGVVRYLAGTTDYGITFGMRDDKLIGYCDADYATDTDTRRSTSGYVFTLYGGAITWQSKRQPTVAASTTEAEYMAAAAAVKEALWLRQLFKDFGLETGVVTIMADNQAAINILKNPISSLRSKHIDVVHHFARERVMRKEIEFKYIPTFEQVADVLTKALPDTKHTKCLKGMGMM